MVTLKKWNIVDHLGDKAVREQYLADVFKDGDVERNKLTEFNSNNTKLLNKEEIIEKMMQLDYIKERLNED